MGTNGDSFFFNAKASYKDLVTLYLDISPKDDTLKDFFYDGPKAFSYQEELEELKTLSLGKTITELKFLSRNELSHEHKNGRFKKSVSALSLTLLKEAILLYLGENKTYREVSDYVCVCFGVTKKEIAKAVIANKNYSLTTLVQETKATSACGLCLKAAEELILKTRLENGLIEGMDNSRSRVNSAGEWIKILGLYPAELLIKIDELKMEWMEREKINDQFALEIIDISGFHLDFKVQTKNGEKVDSTRATGLLSALSEYLKSKTGVLFFLHHF
jgi:bacterioferritin-associated ferredoxin